MISINTKTHSVQNHSLLLIKVWLVLGLVRLSFIYWYKGFKRRFSCLILYPRQNEVFYQKSEMSNVKITSLIWQNIVPHDRDLSTLCMYKCQYWYMQTDNILYKQWFTLIIFCLHVPILICVQGVFYFLLNLFCKYYWNNNFFFFLNRIIMKV